MSAEVLLPTSPKSWLRITWWRFAALGLGLLGADLTHAQAEIPVTGVFQHASGMRFPDAIGDVWRLRIRKYNPAQTDISADYEDLWPRNAKITVYVYPDNGDPLDRHFSAVEKEVKDHTPSAQLTDEGNIALKQGDETIRGRSATWEWQGVFKRSDAEGSDSAEVPIRSRLYLFKRGRWFVKYRVTNPISSDEEGKAETANVMNTLTMPSVQRHRNSSHVH